MRTGGRNFWNVAALSLMVAAPVVAHAQTLAAASSGNTGSNRLEIVGNAPAGCVIATPAQGAVTNATVTPGPNSAQVEITQLVNPNTAVPEAATVDMQFPVTCNTAHSLTISTVQGGLSLQASAPPPGPGFRNHLDYQVTANWVGQQVTGTSSAPVQISSSNAAAGLLDVSVSIPAGGQPLEAGTYSDSLVVNIVPAS